MIQRLLWIVALTFAGSGLHAEEVIWQASPLGEAVAGQETRVTVFALNRGPGAAEAPLPERIRARVDSGETH